MSHTFVESFRDGSRLTIKLRGSFDLHSYETFASAITPLLASSYDELVFDLTDLAFIDTATTIYMDNIIKHSSKKVSILNPQGVVKGMLDLVATRREESKARSHKEPNLLAKLGQKTLGAMSELLLFVAFLGEFFTHFLLQLRSIKTLRVKEIAFEINESAIKAFAIVVVTSFLIGLVVAYQGAYQLRTYGANIFIVDMMGLSVLRELSPVITAIVIAGRSASSYTAQIGAMKITQEIDAMRTMGFEPFRFLVIPRVLALMIMMSVLIFVSDIVALVAGMFVAKIHLGISTTLYWDRFSEVIELKHFVIGVAKGPFFAFLIASVAIWRGFSVKDDTQSIGLNTTKSVVEAIFAVIICDAIFSIIFTNLGI